MNDKWPGIVVLVLLVLALAWLASKLVSFLLAHWILSTLGVILGAVALLLFGLSLRK